MQIKAYYDRDLLYTNRRLVNLTGRMSDTVEIVSFNGGNTIDAGLIFNLQEGKQLPTYVVIVGGSFDRNQYFVTSHKFIRKDQWNLTLIRDILSERQDWREMPAYITNGYETNKSSGLRFNRHKFNLNTMKVDQKLLSNDLSLVLFYQPQRDENGVIRPSVTYTADTAGDFGDVQQYNSMNDFPFNSWQTTPSVVERRNPYMRFGYEVITSSSYLLTGQGGLWGSGYPYQMMTIDTRQNTVTSNSWGVAGKAVGTNSIVASRVSEGGWYDGILLKDRLFNTTNFNNNAKVQNALNAYNQGVINDSWRGFDNRIVMIAGKYYRCRFTASTVSKSNSTTLVSNAELHDILWDNYAQQLGRKPSVSRELKHAQPNVFCTEVQVSLRLEAYNMSTSHSVTVNSSEPNMDSVPCKAMLIPNLTRENFSSWIIWAVNIMQNNPEVFQSQLVPFKITGEGALTQSGAGGATAIHRLRKRDHSYNVPFTYNFDNEFVDKECKFVRIKSASGASYMDLTPYLNDGLTGFTMDLSVKPFGSTIYVQPIFKGLNVQNYRDKRGLVIQEDFSITQIDDKWVNYKYNNQNYLNSFNRQIQSQELNNFYSREADRLALERADDEAKRLARETTAGEWGMFDKLLLGIPSMIGGYESQVRGRYNQAVQLDTEMNEALRVDNITLAKTVFNHNMANIKAVAPVISKIDTFDIMFLYSIIIEFYDCTDQEKEYVINYYQHNGAVIGTLGVFADYWGLVVSGRLILSDDFFTQAEFKEINKRLEGGIYTGLTIDTKYTNNRGELVDANDRIVV